MNLDLDKIDAAVLALLYLKASEQARNLSGALLIYCREPAVLRRWGDLFLWAHSVGAKMTGATPFLGKEGPNSDLLRADPNPETRAATYLPLKNPMKVTLVFFDRQRRVYRTERHDVLELVYASLRK
jgi:hypothetical protein